LNYIEGRNSRMRETGSSHSSITALVPRVWAEAAAFIARPRWPAPQAHGIGQAIMRTVQLYGLDVAIMAVLVSIAYGVIAAGYDVPETALGGMELSPSLLAMVIVGAPVMEEVLFRSWLSGKPGQILALLLILLGVLSAVVGMGADRVIVFGIVFVICLGGAIAAAITLRKRAPFAFFTRHFAWFFYLSAIAFAAIHLSNYEPGVGGIALALIVPQFIAGLIFGFARVSHGLWSCIALHMAHNATAIGLVLLAG
jgi:hypothetical protein